jgi:hypothetical protein
LVTEVETTRTRAIFESSVSIEVIVSLVLEVEKKYSGSQLRLITVYSKEFTPIPTKATLLQANPVRRAIRYRLILQVEASFLHNTLKSPKSTYSKAVKR